MSDRPAARPAVDLAAIEQLCQALPPGPWHVEASEEPCYHNWEVTDANDLRVFSCTWADYEGGGEPPTDEVTAWLLVAREAVPQLLARVRALEARLARLFCEAHQDADLESQAPLPCPACEAAWGGAERVRALEAVAQAALALNTPMTGVERRSRMADLGEALAFVQCPRCGAIGTPPHTGCAPDARGGA